MVSPSLVSNPFVNSCMLFYDVQTSFITFVHPQRFRRAVETVITF